MKLLRLLLIAASACAVSGCSSWFKKEPQSSARMYDGDESPHIRMYTDEEGPGSTLQN